MDHSWFNIQLQPINNNKPLRNLQGQVQICCLFFISLKILTKFTCKFIILKPAEILNFKLQAPNLSIDLLQMYANEAKMLDIKQ